jgi:hypothetical protein
MQLYENESLKNLIIQQPVMVLSFQNNDRIAPITISVIREKCTCTVQSISKYERGACVIDHERTKINYVAMAIICVHVPAIQQTTLNHNWVENW